MDTLYIVMPAYNEAENMETVVRQWYPVLSGKSPDSRLVVDDAGSTDGTHELLLRLKTELAQLEILDTEEKGHGPKLMALYGYAVRQGAGYIFQTDSDGQTFPEEFGAFWERREQYDGQFGWRKERGDGAVRDFVERVVCFLLRLYFGVRIPDANAPFRLMKTEAVGKYLGRLPETYELPNIMLTAFFVKGTERTAFPEIRFAPRTKGRNSVNIPRICRIGLRALRDFRAFRAAYFRS